MYDQGSAHPYDRIFYRHMKLRILKYRFKIFQTHIDHRPQAIPLKKTHIDQIAEREQKKGCNQHTRRQEV